VSRRCCTHVPIWTLLCLFLATLAAPPPPAAPAVAPPRDLAALRGELALQVNGERQRAGLPPVAPSQVLDKVAQDRADEIKSRGALPGEAEAMALLGRIQLRMARAGYSAHGWTESQIATVGDPGAVIAAWKEDPSAAQAMDTDYQDLGIGVADLGGVPLYVFLFAWPRSEYFARQTAGLADLQAVRESMLAIVNAARMVEGRPPLVLDPKLNAAAQAHAQDMLARTYYSHESPEGSLPRRRVTAAGVSADVVGENLAAGQTSVENVMEAWLHSSDHRRNILEPRFTHLGVGLAVGSYQHKYKVLWVQDFARLRQPAGTPSPQ
jgi:uncharacterized protein YkwD